MLFTQGVMPTTKASTHRRRVMGASEGVNSPQDFMTHSAAYVTT